MKRTYIIPLRSAYINKPVYKKTPTAVRAVKAFLMKHMKVEDVRLGKNLNMAIWANGIKNPPAKVSVEVEAKDGVAYAELTGKTYNEPTKEDLEAKKPEVPKNKLEEAKDKLAGKDNPKKEDKPAEEIKEKVEAEAKVEKTVEKSPSGKKPVKKTATKKTAADKQSAKN